MNEPKKKEEKELNLDFKGLNFEQALENLLQVKPEKKVAAPKKKSKPKKIRKTRE